jgi:ribosomal protein S18 acetylase RimI-like enzyme
VGRVEALEVDEPDRGRGRGTVAVLAAEEALRQWGCTRVEAVVPAAAEAAVRTAAALGYTERSRTMVLDLSERPAGTRHRLPAGSAVRPMRQDEFGPWLDARCAETVESLAGGGVPEEQAGAVADSARGLLPDGPATPGAALLVLEHQGERVGTLWVGTAEPAWVYAVEVDEARRGRGHGRALMLAAENTAREAGAATLVLNVFAGNTAAVGLYDSLGYVVVDRCFAKPLL